jgi:hypothetical protein
MIEFTQIIGNGNHLYDEFALPLGSPFLSVFDALQLCPAPKADLRIASQGEIAVLSTHDCLEKVQKFVTTHDQSALLAAVFVCKGRSITILLNPAGYTILFDSHSHEQREALVAVADSIPSVIRYTCNQLYKGINGRRGADLVFLQLVSKK